MLDFIGLLNKKVILSSFSHNLITFMEHEELEEALKLKDITGVYSDGMNLYDFVAELEDNISQMYCVMKDNSCMNMEDFYREYGAFKDNKEAFFYSISNLIADRAEEDPEEA